ncbi:glycoside hydrolase superfamily [Hyaloraphidium curvatum]|nr:glycoside hydrolase superfamily [Hyaloraphidium curvatum]
MIETSGKKDHGGDSGPGPQLVAVNAEELRRLHRFLARARTATVVLLALFIATLASLVGIAAYFFLGTASGRSLSASVSSFSAPRSGSPMGSSAPAAVRGPAHDFLWPLPRSLTSGNVTVRLDQDWAFSFPGLDGPLAPGSPFVRVRRAAARYADLLKGAPGHIVTAAADMDARELGNSTQPDPPALLRVELSCGADEPDAPLHSASEAYNISVPSGGVASVSAQSWVGCLRALDTFAQLVVRSRRSVTTGQPVGGGFPLYIQGTPLAIVDSPTFEHRGLMLDTARHFVPVPTLKKVLQAMSFAKLNVLHWHIVDSQAFPLRLAEAPELSASEPFDRIYSEQDVADLVNEAADLGIRVVPEIDIPGHWYAGGRSSPGLVVCGNVLPWSRFANQPPSGQLDVSRNETVEVVARLLGGIARLFPDPLLHVGSDEINAQCYKDFIPGYTADMLHAFFDPVFATLAALNRTSVQWEDAVTHHGLQPPAGSLLQVWSDAGNIADLVRRGYGVIASPSNQYYLDCGHGNWIDGGRKSWCDPPLTAVSAYLYDPEPGGAPGPGRVVGGELAMWAESTDPRNLISTVFPRAIGAAGRWWQARGARGGSAPTGEQLRAARMAMSAARERMVQWGVEAAPLWMQWCSDGEFCAPDG